MLVKLTFAKKIVWLRQPAHSIGLSMKFVRYILNGGFIGFFSWFLQGSIFFFLGTQNLDYTVALRASIIIAFTFALVVNYWSQIHFVFRQKGKFKLFVILNVVSILIISELSVALTTIQSTITFIDLRYYAYPIVAVTTAPIVFYIKKHCIFNKPYSKTLN